MNKVIMRERTRDSRKHKEETRENKLTDQCPITVPDLIAKVLPIEDKRIANEKVV